MEAQQPPVCWTLLRHDGWGWDIHIAATPKGLCFVGSVNKPFDEMAEWMKRRLPGSELVRDDVKMKPYAAELVRCFQGERASSAVPFDLRGTPFQLAVWDALREIPYGETRSYSDIASRIGRPSSVRAVGAAIGANPVLISVPCHRVVGKDGALTGYRGGLEMKTRLLELEKNGPSACSAV